MYKQGLRLFLWLVLSLAILPVLLSGQIVFERWYGGTNDDWGLSVAQTTDGGYIITGSTCSFGPYPNDIYLIKTDSLGDTLWTKVYGGDGLEIGYSVAQTTDGGYIVAGYTDKETVGEDVYLIKTDSLGDTLWTRTYDRYAIDRGYSVAQTDDGGYIVGGYTEYMDSNVVYCYVYLVKTDSVGDTIWTKTLGNVVGGAFGYSVALTSDGGYIITGTQALYVYLIKTDSLGDSLWARTYGGYIGYSVQQTKDGGYIIVAGVSNVLLIKTDSLGATIWSRTYGGSNSDFGYSVALTSDGGYVVTGGTRSYGAGEVDVYLIKTDSLGSVGVNERKDQRHKNTDTRLTAHPNPFTSVTTITLSLLSIGQRAEGAEQKEKNIELKIYDLSGRLVKDFSLGTNHSSALSTAVSWDGKNNKGKEVESGVYFVRLEIKCENLRESYREKIIKLSR